MRRVSDRLCRLAIPLLVLTAIPSLAGEAEKSWDLLEVPAKPSLHMLQGLQTAVALAGHRLLSVGAGGLILLSDDNGQSWRPAQKVPVSVLLTNLFFVSPEQGWAIGHGGVILVTHDGGETWQKQLDGQQAAQIELDSAKADERKDDPASQRRVQEAERLVTDGADKPFFGLTFSDATHGMVVGAYGLAFATSDAGASWHSIIGAIDNPRGKHLYAIASAPGGLFIAGEEGSIFRSQDGGAHFVALKTPSRGTFFGLLTSKKGDLVAFGLRGDAYRSGDQGNDWQKLDLPTSGLNGGARLRNGDLVIVDDWGEALISHDDGRTFAAGGAPQAMGLIGVVEAEDGSLAAAGTRGDVKLMTSTKAEPNK